MRFLYDIILILLKKGRIGMNQILSTENNNKHKKNNKNSSMLDMRKIIIIFSALIIIFALIIVCAKAYGMIKEKQEDTPMENLNKPSITIDSADNICTLTVSYDEGLEKVTYYWNDEDELVKNMNGFTEPFTTQIIIPEGDYNVLHVIATGIDGSINEISQEFAVEDIQDPNKPEISWYYQSENAEIKIVVKSEKGIKNLTYQWEGEEEIVIESTEENQKELSTTIAAKRGTNDITITATDLEGNTQVKDDIIQGIYAPEIKVQLVNNKTIVVNVSHDMGFKKVVIKINNQEIVYDETHPQYSPEITDIDTSLDVEPGQVKVSVSVYTLEKEDKEYTYEGFAEIT